MKRKNSALKLLQGTSLCLSYTLLGPAFVQVSDELFDVREAPVLDVKSQCTSSSSRLNRDVLP